MPALLDRRIDALRASEYWYLDAEGRVYLDYTGAGLPAQAQLTAHTSRMHGRCFGNPHSVNPASAASTELIERARDAIRAALTPARSRGLFAYPAQSNFSGVRHPLEWIGLADGETRFEDGTPSFLQVPDVEFGLAWIQSIGLDEISQHVKDLTEHLLGGLGALRHGNGEPMIRVHGPSDTRDRGGTVAFSLLDPHGTLRKVRAVEQAAADAGICVRTGCFCNPRAAEAAFGFTGRDPSQMPGGGAVREVNGPDRHPIYDQLTAVPDGDGEAGDIQWNFEKFVLRPDGSVAARFRPMTAPDDPAVLAVIEENLPA